MTRGCDRVDAFVNPQGPAYIRFTTKTVRGADEALCPAGGGGVGSSSRAVEGKPQVLRGIVGS